MTNPTGNGTLLNVTWSKDGTAQISVRMPREENRIILPELSDAGVYTILVFELEVLNLMNFIIVGFPQSEHRSAFQFQFQFQFHNVVNVTSYHGLLFALQFYDIRLHLLFIFFLCFNSVPQYRI